MREPDNIYSHTHTPLSDIPLVCPQDNLITEPQQLSSFGIGMISFRCRAQLDLPLVIFIKMHVMILLEGIYNLFFVSQQKKIL